MKRILFVLLILLLIPSVVMAQPPSIPLMLEGVEDCKVEFNGVTYYPESNYLLLSGKVGDRIVVTKGITKVYYYTDPMECPFLYIDMYDRTDTEIVTESYLDWIRRVWLWLKGLSWKY